MKIDARHHHQRHPPTISCGMQHVDRSEKDEAENTTAQAGMANEESSENAVSMGERLRLSLLLDDPDVQQPYLPAVSSSPPIEVMEVDKEPVTSQMEDVFSALSAKDGQQFPQQPHSYDDLHDFINTMDMGTDDAKLYNDDLRERQQELEACDECAENGEDAQHIPAVNPGVVFKAIYAENRKVARRSHSSFDNLGPQVTEPLYREPSDTAVYHENKKKYEKFKKPLMLYLKRKAQERKAHERQGKEEPSPDIGYQHMQAGQNELGQKNSTAESKAEEKEQRQFFEEQSPDMEKRQAQLRLPKEGKRKRRGADMQVILGPQEQGEKRRKRSCAKIPPLLTAEQRSLSHEDHETLVEDPMAELKERYLTNVWDDQEKKIFREKLIRHPKKFGIIASYLDKKSVADCVEYYYLSKKRENFKQLMRKKRTRKRSQSTRARSMRARRRKALARAVPVSDSVCSSGSSSTIPASASATSGMVMTETLITPSTTDTAPCAAATCSLGNALTQEQVAPALPPDVGSPLHGPEAPTPPPSQI